MDFTKEETDMVYHLVSRLIGSNKAANDRAKIFLTNIRRRMNARGVDDLNSYLNLATNEDEEYNELISALTIHTTHWFRESVHYRRVAEYVNKIVEDQTAPFIQALSFGCSTGEEVYSLAFVFEQLRRRRAGLDYKICGYDIDPVSVNTARKGVYKKDSLNQIPFEHRRNILHGTGASDRFFAIKKSIRGCCEFGVKSILDIDPTQHPPQDIIFCRNILIYFNPDQIKKIIGRFFQLLKPGGIVVLGHSEGLIDDKAKFRKHGNTIYEKIASSSGGQSVSLVGQQVPPTDEEGENVDEADKAEAKPKGTHVPKPDLIVIGSSTGGTEALMKLLDGIGSNRTVPPILIVQHIPKNFSGPFAERLAQRSGLQYPQVKNNMPLQDNHLYMAQGNYHIGVKKSGSMLKLIMNDGPPINSHRPAVENLFATAAKLKGVQIIATILTGMGKDGAQAMVDLQKSGAFTIAQSEESCVVFGMPKEAIRLGAANSVGDLDHIRSLFEKALAQQSEGDAA